MPHTRGTFCADAVDWCRGAMNSHGENASCCQLEVPEDSVAADEGEQCTVVQLLHWTESEVDP